MAFTRQTISLNGPTQAPLLGLTSPDQDIVRDPGKSADPISVTDKKNI